MMKGSEEVKDEMEIDSKCPWCGYSGLYTCGYSGDLVCKNCGKFIIAD
jgi:hypothetical protein